MKSSIYPQCFIVILLTHMSSAVDHQLSLRHPRYSHHGLAVPVQMTVTVGYDVLLKLSKLLTNQQSCIITTPLGENFTTTSPPNARYESWSDGCGVRVRNVQLVDEGRWRLTASRSDHTITGFSTVHVVNASTVSESSITLSDSAANQLVNLTDLPNTYCMVAKPFTTSVLVQGQCLVTVDKVSRALQGVWNIQLALPGVVAEVPLQQPVAVEAERLDTGFISDTTLNKLHIYCNILHTEKVLKFCRFQRTAHSGQGYSVSDGLSDGNYSYYGEGYEQKHCGITIEHPTAQDYTAWRCSVGVIQESGERSTMQGLVNINIQTNSGSIRKRRDTILAANSDSEDIRTVLSVNGTQLTVSCESDEPLSYCWFRVDSGTVWDFTPGNRVEGEEDAIMWLVIVEIYDNPLIDEEGPCLLDCRVYLQSSAIHEKWYSGEGLEAGDCGVTFAHANFSFSGIWTCHMGPRNSPGLELTEDINVRVTGHLAATHKVLRGDIGGSATLRCQTTVGVRPLEYCRFLSSQSVGLNLNPSVTASTAILGRYHFTPGANLDRGDCSLTISYVTSEDIGDWTCAAVVNGDNVESSDTMALVVGRTLSIASIIGMAAAAAVLVLGLFVVGTVKVRRTRRNPQNEDLQMQEMPEARISSDSSSTEGSITHFRARRSE